MPCDPTRSPELLIQVLTNFQRRTGAFFLFMQLWMFCAPATQYCLPFRSLFSLLAMLAGFLSHQLTSHVNVTWRFGRATQMSFLFEGKIAKLCALVKSTILIGFSNFGIVNLKCCTFKLRGNKFLFISKPKTSETPIWWSNHWATDLQQWVSSCNFLVDDSATM